MSSQTSVIPSEESFKMIESSTFLANSSVKKVNHVVVLNSPIDLFHISTLSGQKKSSVALVLSADKHSTTTPFSLQISCPISSSSPRRIGNSTDEISSNIPLDNNINLDDIDSRDEVLITMIKVLLVAGNRPLDGPTIIKEAIRLGLVPENMKFSLNNNEPEIEGNQDIIIVTPDVLANHISQHRKRALDSNRMPLVFDYSSNTLPIRPISKSNESNIFDINNVNNSGEQHTHAPPSPESVNHSPNLNDIVNTDNIQGDHNRHESEFNNDERSSIDTSSTRQYDILYRINLDSSQQTHLASIFTELEFRYQLQTTHGVNNINSGKKIELDSIKHLQRVNSPFSITHNIPFSQSLEEFYQNITEQDTEEQPIKIDKTGYKRPRGISELLDSDAAAEKRLKVNKFATDMLSEDKVIDENDDMVSNHSSNVMSDTATNEAIIPAHSRGNMGSYAPIILGPVNNDSIHTLSYRTVSGDIFELYECHYLPGKFKPLARCKNSPKIEAQVLTYNSKIEDKIIRLFGNFNKVTKSETEIKTLNISLKGLINVMPLLYIAAVKLAGPFIKVSTKSVKGPLAVLGMIGNKINDIMTDNVENSDLVNKIPKESCCQLSETVRSIGLSLSAMRADGVYISLVDGEDDVDGKDNLIVTLGATNQENLDHLPKQCTGIWISPNKAKQISKLCEIYDIVQPFLENEISDDSSDDAVKSSPKISLKSSITVSPLLSSRGEIDGLVNVSDIKDLDNPKSIKKQKKFNMFDLRITPFNLLQHEPQPISPFGIVSNPLDMSINSLSRINSSVELSELKADDLLDLVHITTDSKTSQGDFYTRTSHNLLEIPMDIRRVRRRPSFNNVRINNSMENKSIPLINNEVPVTLNVSKLKIFTPTDFNENNCTGNLKIKYIDREDDVEKESNEKVKENDKSDTSDMEVDISNSNEETIVLSKEENKNYPRVYLAIVDGILCYLTWVSKTAKYGPTEIRYKEKPIEILDEKTEMEIENKTPKDDDTLDIPIQEQTPAPSGTNSPNNGSPKASNIDIDTDLKISDSASDDSERKIPHYSSSVLLAALTDLLKNKGKQELSSVFSSESIRALTKAITNPNKDGILKTFADSKVPGFTVLLDYVANFVENNRHRIDSSGNLMRVSEVSTSASSTNRSTTSETKNVSDKVSISLINSLNENGTEITSISIPCNDPKCGSTHTIEIPSKQLSDGFLNIQEHSDKPKIVPVTPKVLEALQKSLLGNNKCSIPNSSNSSDLPNSRRTSTSSGTSSSKSELSMNTDQSSLSSQFMMMDTPAKPMDAESNGFKKLGGLEDFDGLIPQMRRVDNDMINATLLLHFGGVFTDQERSIVLSLERNRVRCKDKNSGLYGTWIPLARAQDIARSMCIESYLSRFLRDDLADVIFEKVLGLSVKSEKKSDSQVKKKLDDAAEGEDNSNQVFDMPMIPNFGMFDDLLVSNNSISEYTGLSNTGNLNSNTPTEDLKSKDKPLRIRTITESSLLGSPTGFLFSPTAPSYQRFASSRPSSPSLMNGFDLRRSSTPPVSFSSYLSGSGANLPNMAASNMLRHHSSIHNFHPLATQGTGIAPGFINHQHTHGFNFDSNFSSGIVVPSAMISPERYSAKKDGITKKSRKSSSQSSPIPTETVKASDIALATVTVNSIAELLQKLTDHLKRQQERKRRDKGIGIMEKAPNSKVYSEKDIFTLDDFYKESTDEALLLPTHLKPLAASLASALVHGSPDMTTAELIEFIKGRLSVMTQKNDQDSKKDKNSLKSSESKLQPLLESNVIKNLALSYIKLREKRKALPDSKKDMKVSSKQLSEEEASEREFLMAWPTSNKGSKDDEFIPGIPNSTAMIAAQAALAALKKLPGDTVANASILASALAHLNSSLKSKLGSTSAAEKLVAAAVVGVMKQHRYKQESENGGDSRNNSDKTMKNNDKDDKAEDLVGVNLFGKDDSNSQINHHSGESFGSIFAELSRNGANLDKNDNILLADTGNEFPSVHGSSEFQSNGKKSIFSGFQKNRKRAGSDLRRRAAAAVDHAIREYGDDDEEDDDYEDSEPNSYMKYELPKKAVIKDIPEELTKAIDDMPDDLSTDAVNEFTDSGVVIEDSDAESFVEITKKRGKTEGKGKTESKSIFKPKDKVVSPLKKSPAKLKVADEDEDDIEIDIMDGDGEDDLR